MLGILRNCMFILMLVFLLVMSLISPNTVTTVSFSTLFVVTLLTAFILNIKDEDEIETDGHSASYPEDLQATHH